MFVPGDPFLDGGLAVAAAAGTGFLAGELLVNGCRCAEGEPAEVRANATNVFVIRRLANVIESAGVPIDDAAITLTILNAAGAAVLEATDLAARGDGTGTYVLATGPLAFDPEDGVAYTAAFTGTWDADDGTVTYYEELELLGAVS